MTPTRTSHIYLFGVALATAGFVLAAPGSASAQDEAQPAAPEPSVPETSVPASPELNAEQQDEFDSWPPERRAEYDLWPAETQSYYWDLPMPRQKIFWALADQDKIALTAMTGPERDAAWEKIEARASAPA